MKKCKICGVEKPLTEMKRRADAKEGYLRICKECHRQLPKEITVKEKQCSVCKVVKPLEEFYRGTSKYKRQPRCKQCAKKLYDTPERLRKNTENRNRKRKEDPEYRQRNNDQIKARNRRDIPHYLYSCARGRAKQKNLEFSISKQDIVVPEFCPLLGIKMEMHDKRIHSNSYTLDRVKPELGYVPGNIWVISAKANVIKNNATLEELILLTENFKKNWHH